MKRKAEAVEDDDDVVFVGKSSAQKGSSSKEAVQGTPIV